MDDKKRDPIFSEADKYKEYFEEDEKELTDLINRLIKLQVISDKQIEEIANATPGRGTQHYLIEHMTNAIAIQNQYQSVLKEKRQIKEKALEMAMKNLKGEDIGDGAEILANLQKFLRDQKRKVSTLEDDINEVNETPEDIDLDAEIEKKLGI